MDADGANQIRLAGTVEEICCLVGSPDGSKIAFYVPTGSWFEHDLYVMDADGSNPTRIAETVVFFLRGPLWSPDSGKLVFTCEKEDGGEICVINPDGSGETSLTNSLDNALPSWSPDGTKIAFVSWRGGFTEIYVMEANGTGQTRLTTTATGSESFKFSPTWSPDGEKIAFVSEEKEIYVMDADGSNLDLLTGDLDGPNPLFTWSFDSNKIAFCSSGVEGGLTIIEVDGNSRFLVDEDCPEVGVPGVWAPDSNQLAFIMEREAAIYLVNGDGSKLTRSTGENRKVNGLSWVSGDAP